MSQPPPRFGPFRRLARGILLVYLVLLAASTLYRTLFPSPRPSPEVPRIEIEYGNRVVEIAYREWPSAPPAPPQGPVVVLLHGSPGRSANFEALAPALASRYRVLAPDLPGFGASTRSIDDYSIRTQAVMVAGWLRGLQVKEIHLLGFSMGGGVALELIEQSRSDGRAGPSIRSLTLLSAIGVQELELLGNYHLNHALHGLQLGGLWVLHRATPHFGWLDDSMLSLEYARNFYDTDQRPLRSVLDRVETPTLILHGRSDPLVPVAAALEHHRLLPQSELTLFDGSHFMVFRAPAELTQRLADFLQRVDEGAGIGRAQASAERLTRARQPYDPATAPPFRGSLVWLVGLLIAAATLISEDLTCIAAGLLVSQGRLGFFAATLACGVGILAGDLALYGAGRFLGRNGLHRRPWCWMLSPERVEATTHWFAKRGGFVILASRFLPGARLPTYFAAGLLRVELWRFLGWFLLAVALWTPILVGLAALLGHVMFGYFAWFRRYALLGAAVLIVAVSGATKILPALGTHAGRRRLVGAWRRAIRWEFWPRWAFYPPVVLWVLILGIRFRSLTLFTAANPAMPEGGFIGESKADILDGLPAEVVPRYRRLPVEQTLAERRALVKSFGLPGAESPIVLKPDVGQRGEGVVIARSEEQIDRFLEAHRGAAIVQEYVPGVELGVFYVRFPDEATGRIFSITDKQLPSVVGDGKRTVEQLILEDERAVCLADLYLDRLAVLRFDVPAEDETIPLAELGTHCRGAIFLDGIRFLTPELTTWVDRVARAYEGFYFGRFDLRAPSYEAFQRGEGIRAIELNGVTSEATHIYDPRNSLWEAYRVLFRQWRLAFEIGSACRDRGHRPATLGSVLRRLLERGGGAESVRGPAARENPPH